MNAIVQKKRKWRGWKTNIETFLKAFSLQNWQHLFKFTAFFMFDFLVVVLSACSGALLDSMLKRYEPILPHSRPPPPPPPSPGHFPSYNCSWFSTYFTFATFPCLWLLRILVPYIPEVIGYYTTQITHECMKVHNEGTVSEPNELTSTVI